MRAMALSAAVGLIACLPAAAGPVLTGATLGPVTAPVVPEPPTPQVLAGAAPGGLLIAAGAPGRSLPDRMADTGGGTQLITAVAAGGTNASRDGTLTWWQRRGSRWVAVGSTRARFGVHGLSGNRLEGDGTTPAGLFTLPMAFGIRPNPGTRMPWRRVHRKSWWDENSRDPRYNTWYENCPASVCWTSATHRRHASERLIRVTPQYTYAVVIGFNTGAHPVRPPARPSGSGIFLHVFGPGHTAGCVSVSRGALVAILRWLDPAAAPHIAIGNARSIYGF